MHEGQPQNNLDQEFTRTRSDSLPHYSLSEQREIPGFSVNEVLVAGNRGPCGGVNMAYEAATQVLDIVDGREPVYTNWDIVNNTPVMEELGERGLVSVKNDLSLPPVGSIMLFSAHGVPPEFYEIAEERNYLTIDATCQLVNRVHILTRKALENGTNVVYVGTKGHPETNGVLGEGKRDDITGKITLVETLADVESLKLPDNGENTVVYSQTTLSAREVSEQMRKLRHLFPEITIPPKKDICYAADNRQAAVYGMLQAIDMLLIVGSQHSHNSRVMKEIGDLSKIPSYLLDRPRQIDESWFTPEIQKVGVSSGASVFENYTEDMLNWFRDRGADITYLEQVVEEREMTFKLPQDQIDALYERYASSIED